MSDERVRRRVVIHGRVQGVFFRASTRDEALRHEVGGWVRNRPDGTVEAAFEGPAARVDALLRFVRSGPPGAAVSRVEDVEEPPEGERDFRIR
jgi:acylphosphatase